jgi:hypothetical protein
VSDVTVIALLTTWSTHLLCITVAWYLSRYSYNTSYYLVDKVLHNRCVEQVVRSVITVITVPVHESSMITDVYYKQFQFMSNYCEIHEQCLHKGCVDQVVRSVITVMLQIPYHSSTQWVCLPSSKKYYNYNVTVTMVDTSIV